MKYFFTLILSCIITCGYAQQVPRDLTVADFLKDIQIMKQQGSDFQSAIWVPMELWDVVANADPNLKKSDIDMVKRIMSPYTIIVAESTLKKTASQDMYNSYDDMKKNIKLVDGTHNEYLPLDDKDISDTARIVINAFAQKLGEATKGAYVFFFKTNKGVNTNVAAKTGSFKMILYGQTFAWAMPLPTLLPAKYCPVDAMKMKGDWLYCPYHGAKL